MEREFSEAASSRCCGSSFSSSAASSSPTSPDQRSPTPMPCSKSRARRGTSASHRASPARRCPRCRGDVRVEHVGRPTGDSPVSRVIRAGQYGLGPEKSDRLASFRVQRVDSPRNTSGLSTALGSGLLLESGNMRTRRGQSPQPAPATVHVSGSSRWLTEISSPFREAVSSSAA